MNNDTFDRFYNEFKDWSKEDILRRTYNIILDDADKTRQIEQLENIINEATEFTNSHFKEMVADEEAQVLLNILNKGSE